MIELTKANLEGAAAALSDAFYEDGLVRLLCPEEAGRAERIRPVFRFSANLACCRGEARAHSPELEGVALWLYSWAMTCPLWRWFAFGGLDIRKALGAEAYGELTAVSGRIDRARDSVAPQRYLYLSTLGVRPQFRRRGVATALVAERVRRAAAEGLPTIVETNSAEALAFYRSVGFAELTAFQAAQMDYYVLEYK